MSLSSLMHHPHQSDPVKLRKRSLWFAFASSCALLKSRSQSDSARAKPAKTSETAAATRNKRGVFTPPSSMQLQAGARAAQGTAPGSHYFFQACNSPTRQRRAIGGNPDLAQMFRDEFGHLEHAHLTLAVKYRLERVVGVDHDFFLFVLQTTPLDVCPKLFCKLRPR